MGNRDIVDILLSAGCVLCIIFIIFLWSNGKNTRYQRRIARITKPKSVIDQKKFSDVLSLRRKTQESSLPFISKILNNLPSQAALRGQLERAGLNLAADLYVIFSLSGAIIISMAVVLLRKSPAFGMLLGMIVGIVFPYLIIGIMGTRRVKKFLTLFPDAIDFIVRGLRSGLPVAESINMVGKEMEEPVGTIFASIGHSVRLGVPLEKALQDMGRKLNSTEFNFFITSIILQRETGGNLSEILSNLSEVLRKRFMMHMKIKALSAEARASAYILGALPFLAALAFNFTSPGYLDPLIDTTYGNIALGTALVSLTLGVGIMIKMSKFKI